MKIVDKPVSGCLNYMAHGPETNAERWNISPNANPKFKSGPETVAEQLLLGRKRPKDIVFDSSIGLDGAIVYFIYENPHKLGKEWVDLLIELTGNVLQYGYFGGRYLFENRRNRPDIVKLYNSCKDLFWSSKIEDSMREVTDLLSSIQTDEDIESKGTSFSAPTTELVYSHGGLRILKTSEETSDLIPFYDEVVTCRLLALLHGDKCSLCRVSRTRVPGFYKKVKALNLKDEQITDNDPTGILTFNIDPMLGNSKLEQQIISAFRSI